jgi:predicted MPP superfamily phosphohydrolase
MPRANVREMLIRYGLAVLLFHAALLTAVVGIVRRWRRRLLSGTLGGGAVIGEAAAFAATTLVLAGVGALVGPPSGFTVLRFLCQGMFGETVLLLALLAALHARRRSFVPTIALALLAALLVGIYWDAYHVEPHALTVSTHTLDRTRAGSPSGRLRIVHLTDIQTDRVGDYERRAFQEALAQSPDIVVMTGDYVQPRLEPTRVQATADLQALLRGLPLVAPLGVYAVCGDVDSGWPRVLDGTGVTALTGDVARIALRGGRHLSLIGLTAGMSRGHDDPALLQLVRGVPASDLRIAIGHNPNFAATLATHAPVDLALAGHTHGGQVVLPLFGAPMTKMNLPRRYASGLAEYEGMPLHVSRGVGMERGAAPQIRFLCRPEICVVDVLYSPS